MKAHDEIDHLSFVEQAHVEFAKLREDTLKLIEERRRYRALLEQVQAAGHPHASCCDCEFCEAWRAVDQELSK